MNGAQQAQRRTAVLELHERINNLAGAFDAELKDVMAGLIDRDETLNKALRTELQGEIKAEAFEAQAALIEEGHVRTAMYENLCNTARVELEEVRDRLLRFERLHFATGWRGTWNRLKWVWEGAAE